MQIKESGIEITTKSHFLWFSYREREKMTFAKKSKSKFVVNLGEQGFYICDVMKIHTPIRFIFRHTEHHASNLRFESENFHYSKTFQDFWLLFSRLMLDRQMRVNIIFQVLFLFSQKL